MRELFETLFFNEGVRTLARDAILCAIVGGTALALRA